MPEVWHPEIQTPQDYKKVISKIPGLLHLLSALWWKFLSCPVDPPCGQSLAFSSHWNRSAHQNSIIKALKNFSIISWPALQPSNRHNLSITHHLTISTHHRLLLWLETENLYYKPMDYMGAGLLMLCSHIMYILRSWTCLEILTLESEYITWGFRYGGYQLQWMKSAAFSQQKWHATDI